VIWEPNDHFRNVDGLFGENPCDSNEFGTKIAMSLSDHALAVIKESRFLHGTFIHHDARSEYNLTRTDG
jgi:hypothetical protein